MQQGLVDLDFLRSEPTADEKVSFEARQAFQTEYAGPHTMTMDELKLHLAELQKVSIDDMSEDHYERFKKSCG